MKSIIIGAGTYGEVYLAYLREAGVDVVGFIDDNPKLWNYYVQGIPVLGGIDLLEKINETIGIEAVYCPIGDNLFRVHVLDKAQNLGYCIPNYIHPSVNIAPEVCISHKGVYILPNTTILPHVYIEDYVMISTGTNIIHHSKLKKGVFLSNGVNLGANIIAKEYAYVGMGATIMTGVKELGSNCLIGAGAVVIKDVPDNAVMAGIPAKVVRIRG